jgi:hypothetical protein
MDRGLKSDPEGAKYQFFILIMRLAPAWVAQADKLHRFCVQRILSLELLLLFFHEKSKKIGNVPFCPFERQKDQNLLIRRSPCALFQNGEYPVEVVPRPKRRDKTIPTA